MYSLAMIETSFYNKKINSFYVDCDFYDCMEAD